MSIIAALYHSKIKGRGDKTLILTSIKYVYGLKRRKALLVEDDL